MSNRFSKIIKKMTDKEKIKIDEIIKLIIDNPKIGEQKKGDLANVFVYKFNMNNQQYLLAYMFNELTRTLLTLGVHENFYRDLKNILQ